MAWMVTVVVSTQDAPAEWPRTVDTQGCVITIYQPQTDRYEGDLLEGRAAVSIRRADGSGDPTRFWVPASGPWGQPPSC